jgi:UDP-N-acetylglucosamine 3-dehydrogenase
MKKLKIGIVGLGRVASKTHIPVLKNVENIEVVTGVESNPERAERVKSMFKFNSVYTCHDDMCAAETIDAVYICLPNYLHKDACKKALEHRLHVLCEKPMGMSVAEAEEITKLAESKGLVLMPGYKKRYAQNFSKAKKMIEDGLLGKILHVQGTFTNPGPYISWDPKSDWYLDEKWHGVIYDSGCHIIDLLLYLLPLDFGNVRTISRNGFIGYNTPTNITSIFEMEGGISGSITVGWRTATDILSLSVHGTAGSLTVSRDSFVYLNPGTDPLDRITIHLQNAYAGCSTLVKKVNDKIRGKDFYREDLIQAETFCRAINNEEKTFINGRDAIKVHKFLEMMLANIISA